MARAPPELEELRKQLRELLGAEYIQQSKASTYKKAPRCFFRRSMMGGYASTIGR